MEFASVLAWGFVSIAVAGFMDWRGLDWVQGQVANKARQQALKQPLVFEPGESLETVKLD